MAVKLTTLVGLLSSIGLASFLPVINTPVIVGSATSYTPVGSVVSQQWMLDDVDVSAATASTYTQSLADSAKVLKVKQNTGSSVLTSKGAIPGMLNWKASNTVNWRAMRDAQLSGSPIRGHIAVLGDSANAGTGSNGTNGTPTDPGDNARAKAWPSLMADNLTTAGIAVSKRTMTAGTQGLAANAAGRSVVDPRLTIIGSPTELNNFNSYGGQPLRFDTAGAGVTFTPGGTFDTVDVLYYQDTGAAVMAISLDGGATEFTTLNCQAATKGCAYTTITVPGGTTAITFMRKTGTTYGPPFACCRVAAQPGIIYSNGAVSGQRMGRIIGSPMGTPVAGLGLQWELANYAPLLFSSATKNVVFLNGWYNDRVTGNGGVTGDAYLPAMQQILRDIIGVLKAQGCDVIGYGYPFLTGNTAFQRTWQDSMNSIFINEFDCPVLDCSRIITSYSTGAGLFYDSLHLGAAGQPYPAASLAKQMMIV